MLPVCAVVLTLLLCARAGVEVDVRRDMTSDQLRDLYSRPVQTAEWVVRPKKGMPDSASSYWNTHSGVRVTLVDGKKFLIQKGPNYGEKSDIVVTDAEHMSSKWREPKETQNFDGRKTVEDFIAAGGENYDPLVGNCHTAAENMMRLK